MLGEHTPPFFYRLRHPTAIKVSAPDIMMMKVRTNDHKKKGTGKQMKRSIFFCLPNPLSLLYNLNKVI
jgi:hypothetical protein